MCLAGFVFFQLLAYADDGSQIRGKGGLRFLQHVGVTLMANLVPPLAMPNQDPGRAGGSHHVGRDFTRIRAFRTPVDILPAYAYRRALHLSHALREYSKKAGK